MKVISIINAKGGIGKSNLVISLGAGLASKGIRTLVVDLDSQSSLTYSVGLHPHELDVNQTIFGVLKGTADINEVIQTTDEKLGFDIIPASIALASASLSLGDVMSREKILKRCLNNIENEYDIVLIDASPSLDLVMVNVLVASTKVYIPSQAELLCIKGTSILLECIDKVKVELNPELEIGGVIITMYEKNRNVVKHCISLIRKQFGAKVFETFVCKDVKISEATFMKQSVLTYAPNSRGAQKYLQLTDEVIQRENLTIAVEQKDNIND